LNWYQKIFERKNQPDNSRGLTKGEVKELLINSFFTHLADFQFITYKGSTYFFQRTKHFGKHTVYESLNIMFTLKDGMFSCSVASNFNKTYITDSNYQGGLFGAHADLLSIKSGSGSLLEDAYYWHNGKIMTVEKVIGNITNDLKRYGVPYLDRRFSSLETNDLVRHGLTFMENLTIDKAILKSDFQSEMKKVGYVVSRIKHPLFLELRSQLQHIPGQTMEDRQRISGLTFSLLEYYYES